MIGDGCEILPWEGKWITNRPLKVMFPTCISKAKTSQGHRLWNSMDRNWELMLRRGVLTESLKSGATCLPFWSVVGRLTSMVSCSGV